MYVESSWIKLNITTTLSHTSCGYSLDEDSSEDFKCHFCQCKCNAKLAQSFHFKVTPADESGQLFAWCTGQTTVELLQITPDEFCELPEVRKLQRACLRNPVKSEAASKYSTVDTLEQQYRFLPAKYKDCYLVYILTEMSGSTSMVFTRTCDATRLLALLLRNLGLRAIPISGQMTQAKRLGALNKFKAGECNILSALMWQVVC